MPLIAGPLQTLHCARMFARGRSDGKQLLVYSLAYRASAEALLAIPLATPPDYPEHAVSMISLPQAKHFFDHLARGYPEDIMPDESLARIHSLPSVAAKDPMFVPSLAILMQLIGHLPLPAGVASDLQAYAPNAFALVTLPPGEVWLHPFALEFPRRKADQLRFPSGILKGAMFDFSPDFITQMYGQSRSPMPGWEPSGDNGPGGKIRLAGQFLDTRQSRNVVDPMRPVFHKQLYLDSTQRDTVVYAAIAEPQRQR
jgi:hypothetical protein